MDALLVAVLLAAEPVAASSQPTYPEPEFFLPLVEQGFGFEGWVRCLEARVNHFGLGTERPIDEVIGEAIFDCQVVRDSAESAMMRQGSAFRAKIEKEAPKKFDDEWFRVKIPALLSDLEQDFSIKAASALSKERSSDRYDPTAYMTKYRQDAASGKLPEFGSDD